MTKRGKVEGVISDREVGDRKIKKQLARTEFGLHSKCYEQLLWSFKEGRTDLNCSLKDQCGCYDRNDSQGKNRRLNRPRRRGSYLC